MLVRTRARLPLAATLGLALAGGLVAPPLARAQAVPEVPQPSPRARVEQRVGVTDLSVTYSSPAVKGRAIWGALVPYDQFWRTGANASTRLEASRDFYFGGKKVKAGAYALYSVPGRATWTVALNRNTDAPGAQPPNRKTEVARIVVKPAHLAEPRERLTFLFANTTDDATALDLEWEKVRVRIPIKVDTAAHVAANIDAALGEAWRPHFTAGRWLFESGGDVDRALAYVDKSVAIQPTWWNTWWKAQIHAKKGQKAQAVAAAQQAQSLGKGDRIFEGFFKQRVAESLKAWK